MNIGSGEQKRETEGLRLAPKSGGEAVGLWQALKDWIRSVFR